MIVILLNIYVIHHFSHSIEWCSMIHGFIRIPINPIIQPLKEVMWTVKIHFKQDLCIQFLCLLHWVWLQSLVLFMVLLILILGILNHSFIMRKRQEILWSTHLKRRIVFWILWEQKRLNFYKEPLLLNDRLFIDIDCLMAIELI